MNLHIGFTGTRFGMTHEQRDVIDSLIWNLGGSVRADLRERDAAHAHMGDCQGADKDFYDLCVEHGLWTVGHIPLDPHHRAFCRYDEARVPLGHLARNREIVHASTLMLATPREATRQVRGGTWYTIDQTIKAKKPLVIVNPDGSILPNQEYLDWMAGSSPA